MDNPNLFRHRRERWKKTRDGSAPLSKRRWLQNHLHWHALSARRSRREGWVTPEVRREIRGLARARGRLVPREAKRVPLLSVV